MKIRDHKGNEIDLEARQVESSNVRWIGWPKTGEPMLVVQFESGRYAYLGVSRQRCVAVVRAKSVGQYVNRVIKPNFEVVKIG